MRLRSDTTKTRLRAQTSYRVDTNWPFFIFHGKHTVFFKGFSSLSQLFCTSKKKRKRTWRKKSIIKFSFSAYYFKCNKTVQNSRGSLKKDLLQIVNFTFQTIFSLLSIQAKRKLNNKFYSKINLSNTTERLLISYSLSWQQYMAIVP